MVLWKLISQQPDPVVPPKERPPSEPPPSSFMGPAKQIRKCVQYYLDNDCDCTIIVVVTKDRMRTRDCGYRQVATRVQIQAASINDNNAFTLPTDVFTNWKYRADEDSIKNRHGYHQVTCIVYRFDNPGIDRCFHSKLST